jgi:xanthine/uracil permease
MSNRRLGDVLHGALKPGAHRRDEQTYRGSGWPCVVGAIGGTLLTLGAVLVLFSGPAQNKSFFVLIAAGTFLGVAWTQLFRHGFGSVAPILCCFAIPCAIAVMLSYDLPQMPDAWAKDYADVADAAWASIQRALRLKVFLLLAPFVLFFAGLVSVRKLGFLRAVAAVGCLASGVEVIMTLENAKRWPELYNVAGVATFGALAVCGIWLAVVFLGLRRGATQHSP